VVAAGVVVVTCDKVVPTLEVVVTESLVVATLVVVVTCDKVVAILMAVVDDDVT
jgi:hypothetical protein